MTFKMTFLTPKEACALHMSLSSLIWVCLVYQNKASKASFTTNLYDYISIQLPLHLQMVIYSITLLDLTQNQVKNIVTLF